MGHRKCCCCADGQGLAADCCPCQCREAERCPGQCTDHRLDSEPIGICHAAQRRSLGLQPLQRECGQHLDSARNPCEALARERQIPVRKLSTIQQEWRCTISNQQLVRVEIGCALYSNLWYDIG